MKEIFVKNQSMIDNNNSVKDSGPDVIESIKTTLPYLSNLEVTMVVQITGILFEQDNFPLSILENRKHKGISEDEIKVALNNLIKNKLFKIVTSEKDSNNLRYLEPDETYEMLVDKLGVIF